LNIKNKETELKKNKKAVEGAIKAVKKEETLLKNDLTKLEGDKKAALDKKKRLDEKALTNK